MFNQLRIKRKDHGIREVFCVVDGKRVVPFEIYPQALERFPKESDLLAYIERQARGLLNMYNAKGNTRSHPAAA